jgi:hypothetical protein
VREGRERRFQDDTEHNQPLPPQESPFLLNHVDELVEIAPQLALRRSSSQRRKHSAEEVIQMGTKRVSTDKPASAYDSPATLIMRTHRAPDRCDR